MYIFRFVDGLPGPSFKINLTQIHCLRYFEGEQKIAVSLHRKRSMFIHQGKAYAGWHFLSSIQKRLLRMRDQLSCEQRRFSSIQLHQEASVFYISNPSMLNSSIITFCLLFVEMCTRRSNVALYIFSYSQLDFICIMHFMFTEK